MSVLGFILKGLAMPFFLAAMVFLFLEELCGFIGAVLFSLID